jgi:hypothetical protein
MKQAVRYIAVLMLLVAPAAWAQKVDVDFNSNVDFSKFKTYAWLESKHPAKGLWPQRVIDGIDKQLQAKGLKKVEMSQNPDLEVVYNSGVKERTTVEGYDYGYGYGPWWGWGGPRSTTYQTYVDKEATLAVDLVDTAQKEMVWRGVARDTLSDSSEKNQKKLDKALEKMFKKYPPKK